MLKPSISDQGRKTRIDFGEPLYVTCYVLFTSPERAYIISPGVSHLVNRDLEFEGSQANSPPSHSTGFDAIEESQPLPRPWPSEGWWLCPQPSHTLLVMGLPHVDSMFQCPSISVGPETPAPRTACLPVITQSTVLNEVSTLKFLRRKNANLKRLWGSGERQCGSWLRLWCSRQGFLRWSLDSIMCELCELASVL